MNPLLEQLRDIHSPTEPSWWPPGPLFLVVSSIVVALLALLWWWLGRYREESWRRTALAELQQIREHHRNDSEINAAAGACNLLLKRSCRLIYGSKTAALMGQDWLSQLDKIHGSPICSHHLVHLLDAPYSPNPIQQDSETMFQICSEVIQRMRRKS